MTLQEFRQAVALVENGDDRINFDNIGIFDGFGLMGFQGITCTLLDVAALLTWQARTFAGTWDNTMMTEVRELGRYRFTIVGEG